MSSLKHLEADPGIPLGTIDMAWTVSRYLTRDTHGQMDVLHFMTVAKSCCYIAKLFQTIHF